MSDLLKLPSSAMSMNPLLMIASKHGCPTDGIIYPKPVDGVIYTRINHNDGTIELRWKSETL
jgi:hypothetical protein